MIRDLATTNGTKVKGQRVRWAALLPEDKISLGGYKIRIYLGSDEMPSPSEQRQKAILSMPPQALQATPAKKCLGCRSRRLARPKRKPECAPWTGRQSGAAASADSGLAGGGFQILDDDDDDDDEIIDLE